MQRTQNYNLCQWAAEDRILRSDFNADNQKIDTPLKANADAMPRIVTGSYTGDGTYGPDHPNTLTFDFTPKLLLVAHSGENSSWFLWMHGCAQSKWGRESCVEAVTVSGNRVSWYVCAGNPSYCNASYQCNNNGETYRYLAIG